ncbi:glycosyltransferase family 2 protein [Photobacterium leiognathi]|uniref:glycosyltransferase family 2 protein n=1 Tax=Photobacterium leiognathi TaxID=553611 RepID=UPI0029823745|nr:glycosyltransferase family 2 protein [Photobacterium leiognathi]
MIKDKLIKFKKNTLKIKKFGYIDYLSGLWLNFSVKKSYEFTTLIINVNNTEITEVSSSQAEYSESEKRYVFDIHLPVTKIARSIYKKQDIKIKVTDKITGKVLTHQSFSLNAFYKEEFKYITDNINTTLSHLPLINEDSVGLLSEYQKIAIIKNIYDANLNKDSNDTLNTLIKSLKQYITTENSEELEILIKNKEFIALLLNAYSPVLTNPYYQFLKKALTGLMYLDAQSIIEFSQLDDADKEFLYEECVQFDDEKFKFVENFPNDETLGLEKWNSLSEQEKKEIWPVLACTFEYRRQYARLNNYTPDYQWFTNNNNEENNILVKEIIQSNETKWFGISIIVNEFQNGASTADLIIHLQEFVWANWNQDYVNIDSFCYVLMGLIQRELNHAEYKNLNDILIEVFNSRIHKCENDIFRQCLIECITHYINHGIKTVNWSFGQLAEVVRPYYAFDDYFLQNLKYERIKTFDQDYYQFADRLYNTTKAVKKFIAGLSHDTPPTVSELRSQFEKLKYLKERHIQFVEKWILTLSRYCQLHNIEQLYPELSVLHEDIEDYYGALILTSDPNQQRRLERNITEYDKDAKRKDSYWFEQCLSARKNEGDARLKYLDTLHHFLSDTKVGQQYSNEDLIQLLASEIIHYLMQGGKFSAIKTYLPLISEAYSAGHSAILTTDWLVNGSSNLKELNYLAKNCGNYGELKWLLDQFSLTLEEVLTQESQNDLLKAIKQHYVYPYLQVMIYSCNAYENTRHQVIYNSWLPHLTALDIDYCFVVGDAEQSHIDGDKMRLQVLDTYEELPHKTIEMFRFAHQNSHHRYYYKLDDDCVLNVNAMFSDPAFLNQDYFGRAVKRPLGGVDRSWHHLKSQTQEAKDALDLSPEYSEYCDGSTGYILSHWATEQLTLQANDKFNEQLVNCSYFEDKLIGDLLIKANIKYSTNGYNCVIRRKVAADQDLQMWEYGLLPTLYNNIKVLHTEDDEYRLNIGKKIISDYNNRPNLIYRDIVKHLNPEWVSAQEQSPVLEEIFVNKKAIKSAKYLAIIVGKNEQELLPNLLKHHRNIGIEHFLFVDNCSNDNSIEYMLNQPDASVFIATQEYRHSRFAVNWQETLLSHYGLGRWVLLIDSDELYTYTNSEKQLISSLIHKAESEKSNAFYAPMIDFYPKSELSESCVTKDKQFYEVCNYYDEISSMKNDNISSYGPFSNSPILHGGLRERIFKRYNQFPSPNYVNQKFNLIKYEPNMRLIEGLHFMYGQRLCTEPAAIMHFKYHAGFYDKVMREIESGQHWNGSTEYKRYANRLLATESNVFFDDTISCNLINVNDLFRDIK